MPSKKKVSKKKEPLQKVTAEEFLEKLTPGAITADSSDKELAEIVIITDKVAHEAGFEVIGLLDHVMDFRNTLRKVSEVDISNKNEIERYMHCLLCVREGKRSDIEAGWTQVGFQVWCRNHNCNIMHVHFERQRHPANTTRRASPAEILKIN